MAAQPKASSRACRMKRRQRRKVSGSSAERWGSVILPGRLLMGSLLIISLYWENARFSYTKCLNGGQEGGGECAYLCCALQNTSRRKREKVSTIRGKLRKNLYRRKNLHYLNTRSRAPPNGEARFGGFLLIATGCRIAKMQDFPVADMIQAMVLVMPLSALWTNYIAPLL